MKNYTLTITSENDQYLKSCTSVDQNPWLGDPCPGVRYRFAFPNGYEASVIKFWGTYGWEQDQWEMALMKDNEIVYEHDFKEDVIGFLTDEEVNEYLTKIKNIKEATND